MINARTWPFLVPNRSKQLSSSAVLPRSLTRARLLYSARPDDCSAICVSPSTRLFLTSAQDVLAQLIREKEATPALGVRGLAQALHRSYPVRARRRSESHRRGSKILETQQLSHERLVSLSAETNAVRLSKCLRPTIRMPVSSCAPPPDLLSTRREGHRRRPARDWGSVLSDAEVWSALPGFDPRMYAVAVGCSLG